MKNEAIIMLREIKWYFHALITTMRNAKPVEKKDTWLFKFANKRLGNYIPQEKLLNSFLYPMIVYSIVAYLTTGLNPFNLCAIGFTLGLLTVKLSNRINQFIMTQSFFYVSKYHDYLD